MANLLLIECVVPIDLGRHQTNCADNEISLFRRTLDLVFGLLKNCQQTFKHTEM